MDEIYLKAGTRKISLCGSHTQYSVVHPDRIMNEHDLIFRIRGTWEIWQNEKSYTLHAGETLLLKADVHHYGLQKSSEDCETIFIHFSADPEDRLEQACDLPVLSGKECFVLPVHHKAQREAVFSLFTHIVEAFWSSSVYGTLEAEAYLSLLLAELSKSIGGAQKLQTEKDERVSKILLMLQVNDNIFYSNKELAAMIHVHPRTLHNYFMETVGMPVHRYQLQQHLNKAHQMLTEDPTLSLSVVAAKNGFCDEFHFSKYYKKQFGYSPKKHSTL